MIVPFWAVRPELGLMRRSRRSCGQNTPEDSGNRVCLKGLNLVQEDIRRNQFLTRLSITRHTKCHRSSLYYNMATPQARLKMTPGSETTGIEFDVKKASEKVL